MVRVRHCPYPGLVVDGVVAEWCCEVLAIIGSGRFAKLVHGRCLVLYSRRSLVLRNYGVLKGSSHNSAETRRDSTHEVYYRLGSL